MNKQTKNKISKIIEQLEEIETEEREKRENAPDNLYYSERYEHMEEIADSLCEAIELLREIEED